MVWCLASGAMVVDAFRCGVAAGSAAVLNPGTELCHTWDAAVSRAKFRSNRSAGHVLIPRHDSVESDMEHADELSTGLKNGPINPAVFIAAEIACTSGASLPILE
jgi:hypothetical protein